MSRLIDGLVAAVPQGQALLWILGGLAAAFGSGFGLAFGFGDASDNIDQIPAMRATVADNVVRIDDMTVRLKGIDDALAAGRNADRRILCLSGLAATGEVVLATAIDVRCP